MTGSFRLVYGLENVFFVAWLASLVVFCACGKTSAPVNGRAYYEALNCGACHAIGPRGASSGPDLTFVGFRKSAAWLDGWLKNPQAWKKDTSMPNFRLSGAARRALVAYLSGLKGQDFGARRPWNAPGLSPNPVARGRMIYLRAGCVTCHGQGGVGGYPDNNVVGGLIPPLDDVSRSFAKAELVKKITGGAIPRKANPAGPDPMLVMPAWGRVLSPGEIEAVADYLMTLRPSGSSARGNW